MSSVPPDSLLLMGRCGRAHGIRGEVKVIPETDEPERFETLKRVFVGETPERAAERPVEAVRFQPQKGRTVVLLRLGGIGTREDAETLRGQAVFAAEADLPALDEGAVFFHDLIGLAVWTVDDDGAPLAQAGTVADVLEGAAQLLFVVVRDGAPDVLVPDVPEIVRAVDLPAGRLLIDPPEGLFE